MSLHAHATMPKLHMLCHLTAVACSGALTPADLGHMHKPH